MTRMFRGLVKHLMKRIVGAIRINRGKGDTIEAMVTRVGDVGGDYHFNGIPIGSGKNKVVRMAPDKNGMTLKVNVSAASEVTLVQMSRKAKRIPRQRPNRG